VPTSTLRDVAEAAGVHPATASRALNPATRGLVNAETARRVIKVAESLGYRPNPIARGLKTAKSGTVGLVIPDLTNPLFPPIVRGIEDVLEPAGYSGLIVNTDNDLRREDAQIEQLRSRQVEGLIIATALLDHPLLERLHRERVKMVMVNRRANRVDVPSIAPDDEAGIMLAVNHLVALGHRRIAFLGDQEENLFGFDSSAHRRDGFQAALAAAGVAVEPGWILRRPHGRDAARAAAAELLAREERPTAVFATSDVQAIGVLEAAQAAGIPVPEELSVIGFDNVEAAGYTGLTTVAQPLEEMGALGADLLLRSLSGEAVESRRMPLAVVKRASTGPAGLADGG
jgi:LacI family transcriptional regulator, galactose operon repressor